MLYRRVGTQLLYDVTNPELIPLYEGNEFYEKVEEKAVEDKKEKPAKKK